jgi:acyl-CoA synthetase (NDP forming)
MDEKERAVLDRMFQPEAVAVFGGVHEPGKFGHMMLQSLIRYGFKGRLYPVSPAGGEVFGIKVRKGLREVDGPVDLACVCVPAKEVPSVLSECLEKGVKGAEILSSGFAETGLEEGILLQEEVSAMAARGIRMVGPNCFGIHCPKGGLTLLPGFDFSREPGPVAFMSQSGGVATDLCHEARGAGFGFSKVVSYGNGCDLEAVSLLEYLSQDPDSRFIGAYLEGVKDGRRLMEVIRGIAPKKPVVIWKGGLTPPGAGAVKGHTGSMAGEREIWRGFFAQSGAICVEGLEEMTDALTALVYLRTDASRIALLGGGGAIGVFCSDLAHRYGLKLPAFSDRTRSQLRKWFPTPGNSLGNPLDTGTPVIHPELLLPMVEFLLREEAFDVLIVVFLIHPLAVVSPAFMEMDGLAARDLEDMISPLLEKAADLRDSYGKDILVVMENRAVLPSDAEIEGRCRRLKASFFEKGVPVFPSVKRALKAVSKAAGRIS